MAWPTASARSKNWGTEILTDADQEAQLDLLHTYLNDLLNGTTGHGHTGGTNDGKPIVLTTSVSGTLPVANGGTGLASYAVGDILYASASTTIAKLSPSTAGQAVTSAGATTAPVFAGFTTQGDIEYHNGTTRTRLAAGTSGQYLKTQGAGANPVWADPGPISIKDYGSSASTATTRLLSAIYVCYGSAALSAGTLTITNLPFSSSTTYSIVGILDTGGGTQSQAITVVRSSGSQAVFTDSQGTSKIVHWHAFGT